jgi:hypothetical protein
MSPLMRACTRACRRVRSAPTAARTSSGEDVLPVLLVAAAAAGYAPAAKPFTDALAGAARVSAFEWRDGERA